MIDKKTSKALVMRMSCLDYFPTTVEGVNELVTALTQCRYEQEGQRFVQDWLAHNSRAPVPAEIHQCLNSGRDVQIGRKCPDCDGVQFVVSWWLVTKERYPNGSMYRKRERIADAKTAQQLRGEIGENQEVYEAAEMCHCHPGRANEVIA